MPLQGRPLDAPVDLRDVLRVGLDTGPDAVAIGSAVDRMTWRELDETSDRLARNYLALGLQPGDRLASLLPNRTYLVVHYLACIKAGLVATPLNYRYAPPEIDHALGVSGAAALVAHGERGDDLAACALASELRHGIIALEGLVGDGPTLEQLCRGEHGAVTLPDVAPSDPAAIFFTSGSTGPAKGVTHSLETLGWMCASAADGFELTAADTFLPGSSMSHLGSFLWALASFSVGARVVVARTFDAGEILPLLREHRPTVLAMLPAALTALVRHPGVTAADFASLRVCRAGSDSVSLELEHEFSHLVGFLIDEGYGMTEVGPGHAEPAVRADQAGIDRPSDRGLRHLRARRRPRRVRARHRRPGVDPDPQPDHRLLGEPRRHRRDPARRLARLRGSRARRRRRLPVVLRAQEADHHPRRLEHQPDGGGGRARRAPGGLAGRRDRHP